MEVIMERLKRAKIEVADGVVESFNNNMELVNRLEPKNLIANVTEIAVMNKILQPEDMVRDVVSVRRSTGVVVTDKEIELIRKMAVEYLKLPLTIRVKAEDGDSKVDVKAYVESDGRKDKFASFVYDMETKEYVEMDCGFTLTPVMGCNVIHNMAGGILAFMNEPTSIKEVSNIKEVVTKAGGKRKSKKGGKNSGKRYVYKTLYKVSGTVNNAPSSNRTLYKQREWIKSEWERKGHYRHYRDKETGEIVKSVWIKPSTCRVKGKVKEQQDFAITKLNKE